MECKLLSLEKVTPTIQTERELTRLRKNMAVVKFNTYMMLVKNTQYIKLGTI